MDDLIEPFVVECRELVAQATQDVASLTRTPDEASLVDSAFRAFHTLKGSAGLVGFAPLEQLMHAAEDLLAAVRAGRVRPSGLIAAELTATLDLVDRWLDAIDARGGLPDDAAAPAALREQRLRALVGHADAEAIPRASSDAIGAWAAGLADDAGEALTAFRYTPDAGCYFRGEDPLALVRAAPGLTRLRVALREPWSAPDVYDPFQCNLTIEGLSTAGLEAVRAAFRLAADQVELVRIEARRDEGPAAPQVTRTLRVEAARIDAIAATADELVVAKNGLTHLLQGAAASQRALYDAQAKLDRLIATLHADITRIRLTPVASLFARFPRIVRETASALGKAVDFSMEGETVEVDKAVADALYEPLLHMLRNALDHGIEAVPVRRAAGKPAKARLELRARAAGDQVVIEVADDGRGVDPEAVRRAAVAKGVRTEADAARLDDREALDLIFAAGFSTAARVGQLSGRGVGMDAVRSAATALGGRASVDSAPGLGTTVRLTLPATVVLARVMRVRAGGEDFGVMLDTVIETTRVARDALVPIRAGQAFVLRDRAVPLVRLAELVGTGGDEAAAEYKVLVVRAGEDLVGVAVDRFADRFDAPLRPMTGLLAGMRGVLGSTLLGDGRVLMILDLPELIG